MGKPVFRTLVFAISAVVIMSVAGCEKPEVSVTEPSKKQSKIIAYENMQLKKQIEEQKQLHDKEMKEKKQLIDTCQEEKKALAELSRRGLTEFMGGILMRVGQEANRLRDENKNLRAQIEELQTKKGNLEAETEQLKKELEDIKTAGKSDDSSTP